VKNLGILLVLLAVGVSFLFVSNNAAQAEDQNVLYTFKNDKDMAEFEQLYVSKQATFGRMGVLQAYFSMEQNNLAEIDRQITEKFGFKLDSSKMYDLNRETKEIIEVGVADKVAPAAEAK